MTLEQQRAFEETRGRIQQNLDKLGVLSRSQTPPGEYFTQFLALSVNCLDALGGAVWWKESEELKRIAEIHFGTSGYNENPSQKKWIDAILDQTISNRQLYIVAAADPTSEAPGLGKDEISNTVTCPFFYHPLLIGEQAVGVVQVWLSRAGDPRTYKDIAAFVSQLGAQAETYLKGWQISQLSRKNQQVQTMLRMQGELVGELDPKTVLSTGTNYFLDLAGADLACVFTRKGRKWHLLTASNQETVDARADKSLSLTRLAESLPEDPEPGLMAADDTEETNQQLLASAGVHAIAWHHFSSSKKGQKDLLLFAGKNEAVHFTAETQQMMSWVTAQLMRGLESATHFHHLPLRPVVAAVGRLNRAWRQHRRRKIILFGILPAVTIIGMLFIPVPWRVAANCIVLPKHKAFVIAEANGRVTSVKVNEGDLVVAQQLLGKIDDTDFLTQMAISKQQLLRWQVEQGKAHALGNEAERKIAEIGSKRESEGLKRLEFLRSRTELRSPIDGVVLTRGLRNKKGEAMEPGKLFCEIASTGDDLLQLEIKQTDLGDVLGALENGRSLEVDFLLHSHPLEPLQTTLSGVESLSQLPELRDQASVFLATAPFPTGTALDGAIKPGYTGKAKILLGRKPLGIVLIRPFMNYLRMTWGV